MSRSSLDAAETARRIAADDSVRGRVQRRILTVVVTSQVLGGAGLATGITVGALLAQQLLGDDGLIGLPAALFTLGAALASFLIGQLSQRRGRRFGLGLGFAVGGLGALGVVAAAATGSIWLLFLSLFVYGAGSATNLQARYSGTDLADPDQRATAASIAMVSTTVGAVAGPNLVTPMGHLVQPWGIPALAGPFLLAALAYLAAGVVLLGWLRPDPFLVAKALAELRSTAAADRAGSRPARVGRGVYAGAAIMIVTQITMLAIMSMTPVHMSGHGFDLGAVGLVIGVHIAAMYLPSLVTGPLVDRVGRLPMAIASGVTLLLAGAIGAVGTGLPMILLALALLGLGWDLGLISGTAMLVDATTPAGRARIQGTVDVLISLAGATGSAIAGFLVAGAGFALLALGGGIFALTYIPLLIWQHREPARTAARPATAEPAADVRSS
ncbi:MAG: MFS transporter [Micropruina sp.]|uniref:MFS transporter n=1 Tax=Micropruina sp. TaxID=2737536 RepID=UPI0039E3D3B1